MPGRGRSRPTALGYGRGPGCYNRRGWACSTAVSAGDSSKMVPSRGNVRSGRDEFRETFGRVAALMAILSQAAGTPAEGAETT